MTDRLDGEGIQTGGIPSGADQGDDATHIDDELWLTLRAAASRLGISPRTARRWVKEGKLPAMLREGPYGETYYVREDDVYQLAAGVPVAPEPPPVAPGHALVPLVETESIVAAIEAMHADHARVVEQLQQAHTAELAALREEIAALRRESITPDTLHAELDTLRAGLTPRAPEPPRPRSLLRRILDALAGP